MPATAKAAASEAEPKHTPGPWRIDRNDGEIWIKGDVNPVCMVTASDVVRPVDEADARLIAAAPDMLAALTEAEKELAQTITDLIGCRADNTMGVAHSRFDEVSQQELARVEAIRGRVITAISKATGATS